MPIFKTKNQNSRDYFLGFLEIKEFEKDAEGKEFLSDEQKEKIVSNFGDNTLTALETTILNAKKENGSSTELVNAIAKDLDVANIAIEAHAAVMEQLTAERDTAQAQVKTLSSQSEDDPTATSVGAGAAPRAFVIDSKASHNQFGINTLNALSQGLPVFDASTKTIVVDQLKSEFGTYLSQGTQFEIIRQLTTGFTSAQYFTLTKAITEYRAVKAHITSVVQQFSAKWTPMGNSKFTPITILNRRHKVNYSIVPAEVADSWLLKLYAENLTPAQMPITRYIIENIVMPAVLNDIEMIMIGKGKYKQLAPGDPSTPADTMDGLETILVDAYKKRLTAETSNINFIKPVNMIDLRTASDAETLAFIDKFAKGISPFFKNQYLTIFCSRDTFVKYCSAYKEKWAERSGINDSDFKAKFIDFTNLSLRVMDCLYGSPIIFTTPKVNMKLLHNTNTAESLINDAQVHDYELRLYGEFWLGAGFAIGEAVFAAVPDGYDPQAIIDTNPIDKDLWESAPAEIPVAPAQEGV